MQAVMVQLFDVTSLEESRTTRVRDVRRLQHCTCDYAESADEIETWHVGGGRLSHLGGCVVERAHVCHSASAHAPHDQIGRAHV